MNFQLQASALVVYGPLAICPRSFALSKAEDAVLQWSMIPIGEFSKGKDGLNLACTQIVPNFPRNPTTTVGCFRFTSNKYLPA